MMARMMARMMPGMMVADKEFNRFILDILEPVGGVSLRRMFGGSGLFYDNVMFALIMDECLYFKVGDETRKEFEAESCGPFTYRAKARERALGSYYELPERLYDEPEELVVWARRAVDAALRADQAKGRKSRRRSGFG